MTERETTDDWRPRVVDPDAVWPGKCGHCGYQTHARACPRCGLHAGVEYRTGRATTPHESTNGDLGRAAYEAWMRERQAQPDPPSPRAWDDLTESTQRYWIKQAVWSR